MKKRMVFIICLISVLGLLQSCDLIFNVAQDILGMDNQSSSSNGNQNNNSDNDTRPNNPIKVAAYERAEYYSRQNTGYEWGTSGRAYYPFDCSGLVERCYEEALIGTNYKLPFKINISSHPSAQDLYNKYTYPKNKNSYRPQKGDLIFLDYDRWGSVNHITHVGIVKKEYNGTVEFIDASNYSGYSKVVGLRKINISDVAVLGFGEMKLTQR